MLDSSILYTRGQCVISAARELTEVNRVTFLLVTKAEVAVQNLWLKWLFADICIIESMSIHKYATKNNK